MAAPFFLSPRLYMDNTGCGGYLRLREGSRSLPPN